MKNLNSKILLFLICFGLFMFVSQTKAEGTTTVQLKVVAFDQVLFNNDFIVNSCPDQASSTNYSLNAWCAVEQLISSQGWTATSTWYPYGVMLNTINQYEGGYNNYWLWFSNSEPGETALNQHLLSDGEKLLLSFGTSPLKIIASATSSYINSTTTLNVLYFDTSFWRWQPATDSTFSINGQEISSTSGAYELWTNTTTAYEIFAKETGFIDSELITINPQLPSANINLRIETASSTIFNQNLAVLACEENVGSGTYSLNGRCAVLQSGLANQWTSWGSDLFLDSIADYINNQNNNGIYWSWFKNLDYGQTALNKYILSENEDLLLIYGINPLRITTSTTTPLLNSTTTLYLEQFGYDSGWNPVWQPSASSTFLINGQEFYSQEGIVQLPIATTSPYLVLGRKAGYLDSSTLTLTGIFQNETSSQPTTPDNPVGGSGSPSFNTSDAPTHHTVDINKAINFLILNQNNDGSIGSSIIYSDWAAIALSAFGSGDAQNKLKNYLSGAGYNTNGSVTDLERRAMALMALSVDPYSETATDYISKIVLAFDGTQIGDSSLFNDDIFALFPLLKAGYSGSDPIISATVRFIISKQSVNGSWGNIDLMAAAIQALSLAKKTGNLDTDIVNSINQSLQSAKNFLKNFQGANGGFNNDTISTSWAVQAILALGEQVLDWENNGNNPFDFLTSRQNGDGGFEDTSVAVDTRIWTTAYVIPAALGKTWDEIMGSFQKKVQNSQSQDDDVNNLSISTSSVSDLSASTSLTFANTSINENILTIKNATSAELILGTSTAPNKILPQITAEQNLSVGESVNSIQQNEPNKENDLKNLTAQISNSINIDYSLSEKTIKIIFYFSAGASFLLGLYLTIKFIMSRFMLKS
ncbi:MAG: terpene cyclase/mutase family protein [Candidatus Nealsonbacteria bacterium]|nr:terpene cyclase/mutase family protein [Candidatus Nealsonbacteria bacterium]